MRAALRHQLVDPVVGSLFHADEVEALTLCWGADPRFDDVWIHLVARGEELDQWLTDDTGDLDRVEVARALADTLEDFISESRFAWGQQRTARYELPDPP